MKSKNHYKPEVIDVSDYPLEDWLNLIFSSKEKESLFVDYMFPNDNLRDQYLQSITDRSEEDVNRLIRKFLFPSGSFPGDELQIRWLIDRMKNDKAMAKNLLQLEFFKRLLRSIKGNIPPWEGNTWILDLLPHNPKKAIQAIHAYIIAHIQFLPDGRLSGLSDAITLIRAKYIESPFSKEFLNKIDPYEFEYIVESLYHERGYQTKMTKKTHDGGIDIIAFRNEPGLKENLAIQCKKTKNNVPVLFVRSLHGVVSKSNYTKGVFIATSEYTPGSRKHAHETGNIELINLSDFHKMMNESFGSKWQSHIDYLISDSMKREKGNIMNTNMIPEL